MASELGAAGMAAAEAKSKSCSISRGYMDGCFDIMHSGHYNAIRQAKALCDVLVVGVHSDLEIEENKSMPVMHQDERYGLLEHMKWIDEIVHDVPYSPQLATLDLARADFCVHGDDMPVNAQGVCAYDEMARAGRLRIVKRTEGVSTTDIIGRLLTMSRDHHQVPSSPRGGLRVNVDVALQHCATPSVQAETRRSELQELVGSLVQKYKIDSKDAQQLAAKLNELVPGTSLRAAPFETLQAQGQPQEATSVEAPLAAGLADEAALRTTAPVQLLASTRRISEFASSRQPCKEDRVVYVSGSFDMFHVGHAQFLKDARALGTFLLVGIHDDQVVARAKGEGLPVMSLNERVLNVCACKWVDEVIIGAPPVITEDLVKTWEVHTVAKGSQHRRHESQRETTDRFSVPKKLGIYAEVPSQWPHLCIELFVERVIGRREQYVARNRDRARREDAYYEGKNQASSLLEA